MSKNKVIVDEKIKTRVDKSLPGEVGGGVVTCGVLLELKTTQSDRFILDTVPTPFTKTWTTDDAPDESWIAEHATQVSSMIIGGLSVAGFYFTAPETYMQKYIGSFEYILKLLIKSQGLLEPLVLTWPSHDRRPVFRKFVSVKRTSFESEKVNFKYQKVPCIIYESLWTIAKRPISIERFSEDDIKDLCEDILEDERNRLDEAYLNYAAKLSGKSAEASQEPIAVELLGDAFLNISELLVDDHSPYLNKGSVHTRCVVPSNSTNQQIKQALKDDIIRSLRTRMEQISEQLQALSKTPASGGNAKTKPKSFSMPRRLFFKSSNTGSVVRFCDYAVPDEPEDDVRARCKEILGFSNEALASLAILSFEAPHEALPDSEETPSPASSGAPIPVLGTKPGQKEQLTTYAGYWLIGATFLGSIFVLILMYLLKR